MSITLTVSPGGVPKGNYVAKFVNVENISNSYGPGLSWQFEIVSGPHAGQRTSRCTGDRPTTKNVCGQIMAGVTGKPLSAGDQIDLSSFVGNTYLVVVVETSTGGSRVESVSPVPTK